MIHRKEMPTSLLHRIHPSRVRVAFIVAACFFGTVAFFAVVFSAFRGEHVSTGAFWLIVAGISLLVNVLFFGVVFAFRDDPRFQRRS